MSKEDKQVKIIKQEISWSKKNFNIIWYKYTVFETKLILHHHKNIKIINKEFYIYMNSKIK